MRRNPAGWDEDRVRSVLEYNGQGIGGERSLKTGGRLVKHARYSWLLLAESHLTRRLFGSIVRRVEALPLPPGAETAR